MATISLGKVAINPGTPVRITANQATPAANLKAHSILIECWWENTGRIFVGNTVSMNTTTGTGVIAVLPIPTQNFISTFEITVALSPNGLNASEFWVDGEEAGDAVLVSGFVT